jgi:two-component system sensor histidine kinase PilS (NtrC family)
LTLFRTVATTLLLVVLAVRFSAKDRPSEIGTAEFASFAIIGTVYLLTLGTGLVLRRGMGTRFLAWAQIAFDLALASSVVVLSGGTESPFTVLFLLAIVGASVLLGRRGAAVAAGGSALAYTSVVVVSAISAGRSLGQIALETATQLLAQFLIAFLSGYVAEQLSKAGGRLSARESELQLLTELQNRIVDAMPSGLVTCEKDGRVTFVNPAGQAILGLSASPRNLTIDALMPGALRLRPARRAELTVQTPRGERTLGLSLTPLEGVEQSSLIVFQDLTELRRMQQELDRLDRLAELGRLSAQLAHEVRNPLASMRGAAQLLAGDTTGTPLERMARLIVTEADRLSGLVDGYLRLARPPPPERTLARLDLVARDTVEMLRSDPAPGGLAVEEELEAAEAMIDPDQVKQVLLNLLRNAVTAARPSGRVAVRVRPEPEQAVLEVWDSAGAIAPADLPRLFEPFFSRREGGTGLGLSTVKAIVHAHDGTITVASEPANGTTFTVRFPKHPGA